ncbi:MAG: hypothetical protein ACRDGV_01060 [Candidatus Limnocylindria bacterium]
MIIPRRIEAWAPRLADAFADGAWMAIWPRVAAYAPIAGLVIGFGVAVLLPLVPLDFPDPGTPRVWSELLPFMMLVVAAGILLGTAGIGLLAGVVVGDLMRLLIGAMVGSWAEWHRLGDNPLVAILMVAGSALITYLLLAIPAVTLPMIARAFAERAPLSRITSPRARAAARVGINVLAAGLLIFFWTRAVVVLIRPVFTWRSGSPIVEAISPVQFQWEWLVGTAVLAVFVRVGLQELAVRRSSRARRIAALREERWEDASPGAFWDRVGPIPLIALVAATVTLLLAGTYEDLIDPILVFAIAVLVGAWRAGLVRPATGWAQAVERLPALGRLVLAGVVGYALARIVAELFWATGSLRTVLVGILLIVAVFVILFPTPAAVRRRPRPRTSEAA